MPDNIEQRLQAMEEKIDRIYRSVEQMRKLTLWTYIIGAALIILPLIGLGFAIPKYLQSMNINAFLQ